ncbi:MAG: ComEA family DNA-binding protein [Sandaracinaceae bacterium]|nr:ComEA family DNA-binding protein [Sandaracinaceae bacterium]
MAWAQARGAPILDFAQETSAQGVVNIQTASAEELQRLPGIGPSKAEAIIAYRSRHPFRRIEDIMRVRGIGRATFRRLQPYLTVSGPTTLLSKVHLRAQK